MMDIHLQKKAIGHMYDTKNKLTINPTIVYIR